jgi:vacuolar iron transporter family protein
VPRGRARADTTSVEDGHTAAAVRSRLAEKRSPSYLQDFIYGAIDGAVTTFAVVAGVEGANLDETIVVILGGANLIADGFSMAASNFLGTRAERQQRVRARHREERQVDALPEGEREEIRQIFAAKGFEGDELEGVVDVITSNRELWVDTMMTEELGLSPTSRSELRAALATFAAFVVVGFLPLTVFVYDLAAPGEVAHTLGWSAVMTAGAFAIVGAVKSRFVDQPWWRSALETLAVGCTAAALAYAAGALLQQLV